MQTHVYNSGADPQSIRESCLPLAVPFARALRPKQWLKNCLVLAAPAGAGILTQGPAIGRAAAAFVAFCLVSSGLYVINDVLDAPADRLHPAKRRRPIAAGELPPRVAIMGAAAVLIAGEAVGLWLGYRFALILDAYVALTLAYSYRLKRVTILDILMVSAGFVLRAVGGGLAVRVDVSEWFLVLVSLAALFVVTGKRYADLHVAAHPAHRPLGGSASLVPDLGHSANRRPQYSSVLLRVLALVFSAGAMAAYVSWAYSSHARAAGLFILLSIAPFALAMGRYTFLVELKRGGAPEDLFTRDRLLQVAVLLWLVLYGSGVYLAAG